MRYPNPVFSSGAFSKECQKEALINPNNLNEYELMKENLRLRKELGEAKIESLKSKDYTKNLFRATDYPAIANSRMDNMGNSSQKRYRAQAINFNGTQIYISTQFFDSDRDAVIEWYRSHL